MLLLNAFIKVNLFFIARLCNDVLCTIQETLRMYPALPLSDLVALEDTQLPLTDGITTTKGKHISSLPIRKGQRITVALASYQRCLTSFSFNSRSLPLWRSNFYWGLDAHEFKPERWTAEMPDKGPALGPYAHLFVHDLSHFSSPN